MFNNLKEGKVHTGGGDTPYVSFGGGSVPLVIIPGLGDGLRTVAGQGLALWLSYRMFARDFRVWIISRKNNLPPGYTTRNMARDLAEVMDTLEIGPACIMGISQGGMIAQWLAIDFPEKIKKLVIGVSLGKPSPEMTAAVTSWITMVKQNRFGDLAVDIMEKTFTDTYLHKWRPFYWLIKRMARPSSVERFIVQAEACLNHDAFEHLGRINCPVLVIGGGSDRIAGPMANEEMARVIPGARLIVYPELGHGAYTETREFNREVLEFLR